MTSRRTRVSTHYRLGRTQPTLDFVDVDIHGDSRMFVDPRALRQLETEWTDWCISLLQSFFSEILRCVKHNEADRGKALLSVLREPNETHLGVSRGRARGSGLGAGFAVSVYEALSESAAIKSGLLEDLEDTALLIDGIDKDRVSDIATNIIRQPLVEYTQQAAANHGIPLVDGVESGPLWNSVKLQWEQAFVGLPVTPYGKLLLVPKAIVRRKLDFDPAEYESRHIIPYLQQMELEAGTELVHTLKSGERRVTKKDIRGKYGRGKGLNRRITLQRPDLLDDYRHKKDWGISSRPPTHEEVAEYLEEEEPDWDGLYDRLASVKPGPSTASDYHDAAESLLTALFYPALLFPVKEKEIHQGRKRIDIRYTNSAKGGFFYNIALHYPSARIPVECKNYAADPNNPELDQLLGRFSNNRGRVGLLVCRRFSSLDAKERFLLRCRDAAQDGTGFILTLDDEDLSHLVELRKLRNARGMHRLLQERFDRLID